MSVVDWKQNEAQNGFVPDVTGEAMSGQGWTAQEEALLRELAPSGIGSVEIARRLKRSRRSVYTKASSMGLKVASPATGMVPARTVTDATVDLEGEIAVLKDKLAAAGREAKVLKKRIGELHEIQKIIRATCKPISPKPMVFKKPRRKRAEGTYSAVAMAGDWHTGEVIDTEATAGWGAYNLSIQEQRVKAYGQKVLEWLETQRAGLVIPRLRVPVMGDMVSGNIHYEYEVTNAVPTPEAACLAGWMLSELISGWAPHVAELGLDIIGEANHDRLTVKPQHKQGALNSWNRVVYWVAAAFLRRHRNVRVTFHVDSPAELDYDGLNLLAMHGHQVRAWSGIPAYGMQRMRGKFALGYMVHGRPFKSILCGHWHEPFELPGWIVNGCLPGTSEFDRSAGRFAPPSQTSFLWHPIHGEFNLTRWNLA